MAIWRKKTMWDAMSKTKECIEDLEVAGTNRHRRECFKIAMKITNISYPDNNSEMTILMKEYVRQLVGPEICDYFFNKLGHEDVEQLFKRFRKFTMGA